jgi:hypothetical protein
MKNIVRVWIGDPFNNGHFNGTAFFIDAHTLVTAKHVIIDSKDEVYKNITLSNVPYGGVIPVYEVVLCLRDIAILKVKKAFKIDKIYFSNSIEIAEDVKVIGFYDKSSSQKNYENRVSGYQSHEHTYELQNHLTHGLSGSPVFLDDKVCGVVKAINTSKNLTYIIPIEELCMEIEYDEKEVEIKSKPKTIRALVEEFLIPILIPSTVILIFMVLLYSTIFTEVKISEIILFLIFYSLILGKLFVYIKSKVKGVK